MDRGEFGMNQKKYGFSFIIAVLFCVAPSKSVNVWASDKTTTLTPSSASSTKVATGETLSVKDGSIAFYAIGKPSMLKIHGESAKMSGTVVRANGNLSGTLEIPLDSFETGMSVRNNHLKEKVFETSKFKTATLTISSLPIPAGQKGEIKNLPFTGKLSLHGVEKDISGTATVDAYGKMSDYQIPPPEFMGMSMQDDVKVSATGEAKPNS
jgi:polyisoprenoid-binding protein YceI